MTLSIVTAFAGKEHVTSAQDAMLNASIVGLESYVTQVGNKLSASMITSNKMRILDGGAFFQGRFVCIETGTFEEVTIENGTQGEKRNDLVVLRYERAGNGVETIALRVVKGTPTTDSAADPEYVAGNILGGDSVAEMPLYRVSLNGLTVADPVKLFTEIPTAKSAWDSISQVSSGYTGWIPISYHVRNGVCTVGFDTDVAFTIAATDSTVVGQLPKNARPPMKACAPVSVYWLEDRLDMIVTTDGTIRIAAPVKSVHFDAHHCEASVTFSVA